MRGQSRRLQTARPAPGVGKPCGSSFGLRARVFVRSPSHLSDRLRHLSGNDFYEAPVIVCEDVDDGRVNGQNTDQLRTADQRSTEATPKSRSEVSSGFTEIQHGIGVEMLCLLAATQPVRR